MHTVPTSFVVTLSLLAVTTGCQQKESNILKSPPHETAAESEAANPGSHAKAGSAPMDEKRHNGNHNHEKAPSVADNQVAEPEKTPASNGQPPTVDKGNQPAAWTAPEHWELFPPSSNMRLANWHLPTNKEELDQGECAVFQFAGGGTVGANINRWIGQFENADGEPATNNARRAEMIVDDTPTYLVQTHGTYSTSTRPMGGETVEKQNYGLFGAVFGLHTPIFVKCTGPRELIKAEGPAITAFIKSFSFSQ